MVASQTAVTQRFTAPAQAFLNERSRFVRFTCADVDALLRLGIVPEDASTELLDGLILLKDRAATGEGPQMIGELHTASVENLSDLRSAINNANRHVRSQQPLVCSDDHMPEPDFMVVRGPTSVHRKRATAAETWCVVEVADSSYERDTTVKLEQYAKAGIQQYIVINLRNRTAEVYTHPNVLLGTFGTPTILQVGDVLPLRVGEGDYFEVPLSAIIP